MLLSFPPGVLVSLSRVCLVAARLAVVACLLLPLTLSYSEVLLVAAVTLSPRVDALPSGASLTRDWARGNVDDPIHRNVLYFILG